MRKTAVNLAIAGMAVAGASAMLPAQAATATPSTEQAASAAQTTAAAAPAYYRNHELKVQAPRNRLKAWASIRDLPPGRDFVAVQTRIERKDGRRWVTVVTGPRNTGTGTRLVRSVIKLRPCTHGKVYRLKTNWNWNGNRFHRYHPNARGTRC